MSGRIAEHITASLEPVRSVVQAYLADLTDADLLVRPAAGMNHIAWQLGHLIASENTHISLVTGSRMPSLPPEFRERHSRATASEDNAAAFCTKADYLNLMNEQRSATLKLLADLSDDELMQPAPESIGYLGATVGCVFASQSMHWMMHAGQWAVVRRILGRVPLF